MPRSDILVMRQFMLALTQAMLSLLLTCPTAIKSSLSEAGLPLALPTESTLDCASTWTVQVLGAFSPSSHYKPEEISIL